MCYWLLGIVHCWSDQDKTRLIYSPYIKTEKERKKIRVNHIKCTNGRPMHTCGVTNVPVCHFFDCLPDTENHVMKE